MHADFFSSEVFTPPSDEFEGKLLSDVAEVPRQPRAFGFPGFAATVMCTMSLIIAFAMPCQVPAEVRLSRELLHVMGSPAPSQQARPVPATFPADDVDEAADIAADGSLERLRDRMATWRTVADEPDDDGDPDPLV